VTVRVVVAQGDAAGGVPGEVDRAQFDLSEGNGVTVVDEHLSRHRDVIGVVAARVCASARRAG